MSFAQHTKFSLEMFGAFFLADVSCKNNYCLLIKNINTSVLEFVFIVSLFTITGTSPLVDCIYEIFLGYSMFRGKNVVYFCADSKPILCLMLYVAVSP